MKSEDLWKIFNNLKVNFFTGVPDSTFKDWMTFLDQQHGKKITNIVACNECEAIAIAAGYHLATSKIPVVYMQNSGEGKTVNPLTSLCDPEVYSIPLLMMVGWRGEPGTKDEPQHKKMGRITISLLDTLEIPYRLMADTVDKTKVIIRELLTIANEKKQPVALIIRKGMIKDNIDQYDANNDQYTEEQNDLTREEAIKTIVGQLTNNEIIVSTTGKTSRELFEYRINKGEKPRDFYTVGSMGCSAAIALGIALQIKNRKIVVLDGDGSLLMQMGSVATIGHYSPENYLHIVLDNSSHDSTGGQPTVSSTVDFGKIVRAAGYRDSYTVTNRTKLIEVINKSLTKKGPVMVIVKVKKGSRPNLGRPTLTPIQNKKSFMKFIRDDK